MLVKPVLLLHCRIKGNQPVAYASKALTTTQQKYAQIERKRLTVVFCCARFAEYIVSRDVTLESDHKPLEAIAKKSLRVAPLRLQRMLIQLRRFPGITVVYKCGESLHLADVLSRAHLVQYLTNAERAVRHQLSI